MTTSSSTWVASSFFSDSLLVSAVKNYLSRNYSDEYILKEFPDLTRKDIEEARSLLKDDVA